MVDVSKLKKMGIDVRIVPKKVVLIVGLIVHDINALN
jgi:hypothetical protein